MKGQGGASRQPSGDSANVACPTVDLCLWVNLFVCGCAPSWVARLPAASKKTRKFEVGQVVSPAAFKTPFIRLRKRPERLVVAFFLFVVCT